MLSVGGYVLQLEAGRQAVAKVLFLSSLHHLLAMTWGMPSRKEGGLPNLASALVNRTRCQRIGAGIWQRCPTLCALCEAPM